jgi:hypothetical protein
VALNSLISAVCHEHSYREFTAIARAEHLELVATVPLRGCLVALDGVCSYRLGIV